MVCFKCTFTIINYLYYEGSSCKSKIDAIAVSSNIRAHLKTPFNCQPLIYYKLSKISRCFDSLGSFEFALLSKVLEVHVIEKVTIGWLLPA